jgi:hypothetical protein
MSSYQDFIQDTLASKTNESKVNQLIASHTDVTSKAKQDDMDLILETDTDNQNRRILKKGGTGILNTIQNDVDLLNEKTTNISYVEDTENNTTTTNTTIAGDKVTISAVLSLPSHTDVNTKLTDIAADISDVNTKTTNISYVEEKTTISGVLSTTDISDVNTTLKDLNKKTTNISYVEDTENTNTTIAGDKVTISGVLSLPNHTDVDSKLTDLNTTLTNLENNNTQSTNVTTNVTTTGITSSTTTNEWTQIGDDINGEAVDDLSGYSVSLSADGSIVAIGAPFNDGNGDKSGHVRVYQFINNAWEKIGDDIDGEAVEDQSGFSVSLSADGSIVAIGAPENDGVTPDTRQYYSRGHVRVFKYDDDIDQWKQIGEDIDGEEHSDQSGSSISLSSDGSIVAIGARNNRSSRGHVRVYQFIDNAWEQIGDDIDGEETGDQSGNSVSISSDGSVVAIGGFANQGNGDRSGHVRVFESQYDNFNSKYVWTKIGNDIYGEEDDRSGSSVSLSADGLRVAIGAVSNNGNTGRVRVYQFINNAWEKIGDDIDGEAAGDQFGNSVSLSSDGSILAIGGWLHDDDDNGDNSGHVTVYQLIDNEWTKLGFDIDGEAAGDKFGYSVSLSANGLIVAIGAIEDDGNGHVKVFTNPVIEAIISNGVLSLTNHDNVDISLTELENNVDTLNTIITTTGNTTTIAGDKIHFTGVLSTTDIKNVNTTLIDLDTKTTNISLVKTNANGESIIRTHIDGMVALDDHDIDNLGAALSTALADVSVLKNHVDTLNTKTANTSYLEQDFKYYVITIEQDDQKHDSYFEKITWYDNTPVRKTVFDSCILLQDQEDIPVHDGALYKYKNQVELMVDDNFYIRDSHTDNRTVVYGMFTEGTSLTPEDDGTDNLNHGGEGRKPEFHFSTRNGLYLYAGTGAPENRTDNHPGFSYYSDGHFDRFRIRQDCDGGGGYFFYNSENNFGKSSDARLKENIEDLTQEDVDFLLSIKPRKYKLKHRDLNCCQYGVIAQEVMEVCNPDSMPQKTIVNNFDAYSENPDTEELLGISYDNFIPLLIKLTQQQQEKIQQQEDKINKLEADIESIKSTLSL